MEAKPSLQQCLYHTVEKPYRPLSLGARNILSKLGMAHTGQHVALTVLGEAVSCPSVHCHPQQTTVWVG